MMQVHAMIMQRWNPKMIALNLLQLISAHSFLVSGWIRGSNDTKYSGWSIHPKRVAVPCHIIYLHLTVEPVY